MERKPTWSSLFDKNRASCSTNSTGGFSNGTSSSCGLVSGKHESSTILNYSKDDQKNSNILEYLLSKMTLDSKDPEVSRLCILQFRGLQNRINNCFLNVVLQALMSCWPFVKLLELLKTANLPSGIPVTQALINFLQEYRYSENQNLDSISTSSGRLIGRSIDPSYFYPLLNLFHPSYIASNFCQEDAQEFLCWLLDRFHEELLSLSPKKGGMDNTLSKEGNDIKSPSSDNDNGKAEEWHEVSKRQKSSIILTDTERFMVSPLTKIFGGKLRSIVKKPFSKSSVTIQPFYCVHLDINTHDIKSLEDALSSFGHPEKLKGIKDMSTNDEMEVMKRVAFDQLPYIFIFHLKRFQFDSRTKKIVKHIRFPLKLVIQPSLITEHKLPPQVERVYSLCAVISHCGNLATKGHYTAELLSSRFDQWIHCDDSTLSLVTVDQVMKSNAYLLFYCRC